MNNTKVITKYEDRFRDASDLTGEPPLREFTEIQIPMPWGHMAGKWYGPLDVRPVVGLHGWLDNAGTYDFFAALLPKNMAFLALDLPGHGLSSPMPPGCFYHILDNMPILRMIMNHFKWQKLALIGHSMSAAIVFLFASLFPELVELVICIDVLKPHFYSNSAFLRVLRYRVDGFLQEVERNSRRPSYTIDELMERLHEGSFQSVDKKRCLHLLVRNVQRSTEHKDRYFMTHDRRVKYYSNNVGSQEVALEMARRITAPFMLIKAVSSSYFEDKSNYDAVLELMQKKSNFAYFESDGTHHFHFNNPESIMHPVIDFLRTYAVDSFKTNADTKLSSKL